MFKVNPFSGIKAEEDFFLFPRDHLRQKKETDWGGRAPALRDSWITQLYNTQQLLITGEDGSGKTASALITIHEIFKNNKESYNKILPIYWPFPCHLQTYEEQMHSFTTAFARSLLSYIAVNPETYFMSDQRHQSAVAILLAARFGTANDLQFALHQVQLRSYVDLGKLISVIYDYVANIDMASFSKNGFSMDKGLQVLANASVKPLTNRILLIDIQTSGQKTTSRFRDSLCRTIHQFFKLGFIVKLFAHNNLQDELISLFSPLNHLPLEWEQNEIEDILEKRLYILDSSLDSLQEGIESIYDRKQFRDIANEIVQLLKYTQNLPGRLMIIGNMLVRRRNETSRHLSPSDVQDIFAKLKESNQFFGDEI